MLRTLGWAPMLLVTACASTAAPGRCPDDARWDGDACVRTRVVTEVECPTDARWDGSRCLREKVVDTVVCPDGSTWGGSHCMATGPPICAPRAAPITRASIIEGDWEEEWPDRNAGCNDRVHITALGGMVHIVGADCTDGEPYEYDSMSFDGERLVFFLNVPQTGVRIRYELRPQADGTLAGRATGDSEADIVWHRP